MEATPTTTPIGRESELATAEALLLSAGTLARAGGPPRAMTLLVVGDAGIGKTTLVRAILARAENLGMAWGEGHCLDVSAVRPLAPVREALLELVVSRASRGGPIPHAAQWLLDASSMTEGSMERLLATTATLAAHATVVLALEDLHWSDRSTRDFAIALARTGRASVLLILTARTDDLTADHPGRPALSELALMPGTVRLEVPPLDEAGIARLATQLLGRALTPDELATVFLRSGGNPLFAEEIMRSTTATVPTSLHDLLIRHVTALSAHCAALVRLASVGGAVIDIDLLGDVSGLDRTAFEELIHEALANSVFTRHGDRFAFRHALLRDAVEESLLPSERVALHRAYVDVLRQVAPSPTALAQWHTNAALAIHATGAGEVATALVAHVDAGVAAKRHGAPEAADHFEAALAMWPDVPNAEALAGICDAEVAAIAADSLMRTTQHARIARLLSDAVSRLQPEADRLSAARVLTVAASSWYSVPGVDGTVACEQAIELASGPACHELAMAWGARASLHFFHREYRCAVAAAERAADVARQAGSLVAEYEAWLTASWALLELGRLPQAREATQQVVGLAERAGARATAFEARGDLVGDLIITGHLDEGCELARRYEAAAEQEGLVWASTFIGERELNVLIARGRFPEARRRLDDLVDRGYGESRSRWAEAELLMGLGELDAALAVEELSMQDGGSSSALWGPQDALRRDELFDRRGDITRQLETARVILAEDETESPLRAALHARVGLHALWSAVASGRATPEGLHDAAHVALAAARSNLSDDWSGSVYGAHLAVADAYADRLDGRAARASWHRAVSASERFGNYFALRPRLEEAREELAHGNRVEGKEMLLSVWRTASAMGAQWFTDACVASALHHRVPLPAGTGTSTGRDPRDRLTPREQDVLDLLTTGATNRAIASTLVISEKTAALHVGNILGKLRVANRGAAAALARGRSRT